jgi:hypothetical protein
MSHFGDGLSDGELTVAVWIAAAFVLFGSVLLIAAIVSMIAGILS